MIYEDREALESTEHPYVIGGCGGATAGTGIVLLLRWDGQLLEGSLEAGAAVTASPVVPAHAVVSRRLFVPAPAGYEPHSVLPQGIW